MAGLERRGAMDGGLQALGAGDVEAVHGGALRILADTGIAVHDAAVLTLLAGAGCRVSREDRRAYLPADVVEGAVSLAPAEVTLYDRLGAEAMALGSGRAKPATQARERVRRILAEHGPPPLADPVTRQLDEIVTDA